MRKARRLNIVGHRDRGIRQLRRTVDEKVRYGKAVTIKPTEDEAIQPAVRGSLIILATELGMRLKLGKK